MNGLSLEAHGVPACRWHTVKHKALILRGIFTLRRAEVEWFYQVGSGGNEFIFPDASTVRLTVLVLVH